MASTGPRTGLFRRKSTVRPLRVLTASSRRLDLESKTEGRQIRALRMGWQSDAWNYRDSIGELRYAIQFLANSAGRMRINVRCEPTDGETDNPIPLSEVPGIPEPVVSLAAQALLDLGRGKLALKGMLKTLSTNISVAGECFMLGQQDAETGEETWTIRSIDELVIKDEHYWLRQIPDGPNGLIPWVQLDPELSVVSRIWIPHPRFSLTADSPLKAMLDDAESLSILRRMIRSDGRSRLGRGLLFVPDELSLKVPVDDDDDPEADPFMAALTRAMMEPISDEGVASAVTPIVIRGPAEAGSMMKHIQLAPQFDKEAKDTRDELIGIIATSFDLPKEVIQGIADLNHWCVDHETEALTREGWRSRDALAIGDEVLTLNHETGLSEWQPVEDFYQARVEDEPMIAMEGQGHSSLTTPNHRWPVIDGDSRRWATTETLREAHRLTLGAPCPGRGTGSTDALLELLAWYWTEGSEQNGQISIAQSHTANPERVAMIRQSLTTLYGAAVESLRGSTVPAWREKVQSNEGSHGGPITVFYLNTRAARPLIEGAPNKCVLPSVVQGMTTAQRERFIDLSLQGDGWHYRAGALDMFQSDPARLDALELAGILAGYAVCRQNLQGGQRLCLYRSKTTLRPIKAARAATRNGGAGMQIREETYTGTIWCPVTSNTTWLARRRGSVFYTGNSAWQVDDNTFRHHIEPHVIEICDALTGAYLRPYLLAAGVPKEWARRVVFWYDPTELVTHPDQTKDALELHDRLVISDDAVLRIAGFGEEDKPSKQEVQVRLLEKMRQWPPNLVMAFLHAWDPTLVAPAMTGPPAIPGISAKGVETGETPGVPAPLPGRPGAPQIETGQEPAAPAPAEQGPPPITASGARHARLSRNLARIDRDLRSRLQTAANAAMLRQLERVGARLRSKVAKDETLRTKIAHRRTERVSAVLGKQTVREVGVNAEQLVSEDWADLRSQFHEWTAAAQEQALATAQRLAGIEDGDPRLKTAEEHMAVGRDKGWEMLSAVLAGLASHLLYNPDPNVGPTDWADLNPDHIVPTGTIRAALAVAGGGDVGVDAAGNATIALGQPAGQIGTGATISELLTAAAMTVQSYTWEHGPSLKPFEGHLKLDGVQFDQFDDPALANDEGWPDNAYFMPGDHEGCSCDFSAEWVPSEGGQG